MIVLCGSTGSIGAVEEAVHAQLMVAWAGRVAAIGWVTLTVEGLNVG